MRTTSFDLWIRTTEFSSVNKKKNSMHAYRYILSKRRRRPSRVPTYIVGESHPKNDAGFQWPRYDEYELVRDKVFGFAALI